MRRKGEEYEFYINREQRKVKINHKKFLSFYSYYFIIIFEVKYQVSCYLYHHEIHKILK